MDNGFTNIDQLVTDYVKGNLHGEVLEMFEAKLAWKKDLQEKVALEREMMNVFLDADTLILKEIMQEDFAAVKPKSTLNKKWWLGGIGMLLLGGGVLLFDVQDEPEERALVESVEEDVLKESVISTPVETPVEVEEHSLREVHTVHPEHFVYEESSLEEERNIETQSMDDEQSDITNKSGQQEQQESLEQELRIQNSDQKQENKSSAPESVDVCAGVVFQGTLKMKKAQVGMDNGSVTLHEEFITGGQKPYLYSMTRSEFSEESTFEDLSAENKYGVYIQDANGCVGMLNGGAFHIPSTQCVSDYQPTFSVGYEQDWLVPVNELSYAEVKLINRSGVTLYESTVEEGAELRWEGNLETGSQVSPGRYNWYIQYQDGEQCVVKMTVVN